MEFTVIKLSDNDLITYHVDTPFLEITAWESVKNDKEFLDWFYNDLQVLTNDRNSSEIRN